MAGVVAETSETIDARENVITEDMVIVSKEAVQNPDVCEENQSNGIEKSEAIDDNSSVKISNGDSKRAREDGGETEEENDISKKQKVEKSVEEERLEKLETNEENGGGEEEEKKVDLVSLGPKKFSSSEEMFNYFYKFLHHWPANLNVNKYEYMVLLDLLKKGHAEPDKKEGGGIQAFQVRYHPMWKSRCFFLLRHDESVDDFSFRKCVDHILPLPDNMKIKSEVNKVLGSSRSRGGGGGRGGRGGGGRGGWRGRERGGSRK